MRRPVIVVAGLALALGGCERRARTPERSVAPVVAAPLPAVVDAGLAGASPRGGGADAGLSARAAALAAAQDAGGLSGIFGQASAFDKILKTPIKGSFGSLTGLGTIGDDPGSFGGLSGDAMGWGAGGSDLSIAGSGAGGAGTGWGTIGTGSYGTLGYGSGTGSGYGVGSGRGRGRIAASPAPTRRTTRGPIGGSPAPAPSPSSPPVQPPSTR